MNGLAGAGMGAFLFSPLRCRLNCGQNVFGVVDDGEHLVAVQGLHEMLVNHLVERSEDGIKESVGVHDDDRLAVQTELLPREAFEEFLHRANSPRQSDHSIDHLDDGGFALVHGLGNDGLRASRVVPSPLHHKSRDNANHLAAGAKRAVSKVTHQPYSSVTIDEFDMFLGHDLSQTVCRVVVRLRHAVGSGAIYSYSLDISVRTSHRCG